MKKNNNFHSLNNAFSRSDRGKDREIVLNFIRKTIEKQTGSSIRELKKILSQERLYYTGLKYVTTTNKAICEALGIPVEAGTRYKAKYHKKRLLAVSVKRYNCPFTKYKAHFYTTNPNNFNSKDFII